MDNNLCDIQFIEAPLFTTTDKPRRTHKSKRINKKWLKRYGYKIKWTSKDQYFVMGNIVIGHPEAIKLIKEYLANKQ